MVRFILTEEERNPTVEEVGAECTLALRTLSDPTGLARATTAAPAMPIALRWRCNRFRMGCFPGVIWHAALPQKFHKEVRVGCRAAGADEVW